MDSERVERFKQERWDENELEIYEKDEILII